MKLLTVLFGAFLLGLIACKLLNENWNIRFAGNFGMAVFMLFTGLAHFKFQKGMAMMIPEFVPAKIFWVYFTGILEILVAPGLLIPELRKMTAIFLIVFLMLVFIANIKSAKEKINIYKADHTGPGMKYLWAQRLPMQLFLIAWTYYFGLYLG